MARLVDIEDVKKLFNYDNILGRAVIEAIDTVPTAMAEVDYDKGLQDARKLFLRLWDDIGCNVLKELFGTDETGEIVEKFTMQQIIAKLEAYEKEQEQIKVGDVLLDEYKHRCVVSSDKGCDDYVITFADGSGSVRSADYIKKHFKKTGKHIDIASLLAEMGKE